MSQGGKAQQRPNVPGALGARLQRIHTHNAMWDDYHQAGVGLSELAETAYMIKSDSWRGQSEELLHKALEYFGVAEASAPSGNLIAPVSIKCDRMMAEARLARISDASERSTRAIRGLQEAAGTLGPICDKDRAAHHQLAITYEFLSRLYWGDRLGLETLRIPTEALRYKNAADRLFEEEASTTPDGQKAYRTHLLVSAVALDVHGDGERKRTAALKAAKLARAYTDYWHLARASAIMTGGKAGEVILRRVRFSGTLKRLRTQTFL